MATRVKKAKIVRRLVKGISILPEEGTNVWRCSFGCGATRKYSDKTMKELGFVKIGTRWVKPK